MTADGLTFSTVGPVGVVHYARCHSCECLQHPGGWHTWADAEDRIHYLQSGRPDPVDLRCGCDCATGPVIDPPEPDFESLEQMQPCPVCGEAGACGYDAEGRPLIHSDWTEDETEPA